MESTVRREDPSPLTSGATLAVNAGSPYEVLAFSFSEGPEDGPHELGLPRLTALVMIRSEDEPWIRDSEQEQRDLFCLLDPAEPESQIAAFTFTGHVSGFRELRQGLAAEFASVGLITPHFSRAR
jgi:hypothetical protein